MLLNLFAKGASPFSFFFWQRNFYLKEGALFNCYNLFWTSVSVFTIYMTRLTGEYYLCSETVEAKEMASFTDFEIKMSRNESVRRGITENGYVCSTMNAQLIMEAYRKKIPITLNGREGMGRTALAQATARYLDIPLVQVTFSKKYDGENTIWEWNIGKFTTYTSTYDCDNEAQEYNLSMYSNESALFCGQNIEPYDYLTRIIQNSRVVLLININDDFESNVKSSIEKLCGNKKNIVSSLINQDIPLVYLKGIETSNMKNIIEGEYAGINMDIPNMELEGEILQRHYPNMPKELAKQIIAFVNEMRKMYFDCGPSIADTVRWAGVLMIKREACLSRKGVEDTIKCIIRSNHDTDRIMIRIDDIINNSEGFV